MHPFGLHIRLALAAGVAACALAGAGAAAADGPVFAVVPNGPAVTVAQDPSSPRISFDALGALTGLEATAASALARESLGAQAVALALRYIGVPYVWGGASPSGFDCSGLATYIYGLLGIDLPHYTGHQFKVGYRVAIDQLQAGDLLFFSPKANGDPGHEGIYIGRGLFVQAPHRGDHVRVSVLDPSRMASYMGAVRPYFQRSLPASSLETAAPAEPAQPLWSAPQATP
jgi:cell wall-associated NlpC family hydrolase